MQPPPASRMRALLAHAGPLVHVDHAHRVAPTGFAQTTINGHVYNVYEKGEAVWYTDSFGHKHEAIVIMVGGITPLQEGDPSKGGVVQEYTVRTGKDIVRDVMHARLSPRSDTDYTAKGDQRRYCVVVRRRP